MGTKKVTKAFAFAALVGAAAYLLSDKKRRAKAKALAQKIFRESRHASEDALARIPELIEKGKDVGAAALKHGRRLLKK